MLKCLYLGASVLLNVHCLFSAERFVSSDIWGVCEAYDDFGHFQRIQKLGSVELSSYEIPLYLKFNSSPDYYGSLGQWWGIPFF